MAKRYRTPVLASVHEMAADLHDVGIIDKKTMKEFDECCLTPVEKIAPRAICRLRNREKASQAVFARHLNVPVSLVSQWERGEKHPSGSALKLLALVKKKGLSAIA
jgi:putative transcriptional regulator